MTRIKFQSDDPASRSNRTRHPDGAISAQRPDLENSPGSGRPNHQLQKTTLQGRDIDRWKIGLSVRRDCGIKRWISRYQRICEEAVDLLPDIKWLFRQGESPGSELRDCVVELAPICRERPRNQEPTIRPA